MSIPKHDDIRIAAMNLLKKEGSLQLREFEPPLKDHFKLTDEETSKMYSSGNGLIFYDRISWALSYLNMAGLMNKPKRGVYELTELGLKMLSTPNKINKYVHEQVNKRQQAKQNRNDVTTVDIDTPPEKLSDSFEKIKANINEQILEAILSKTPYSFEKLVVDLLQKMGYGGEIKDAGAVTKASNDGGIDGIIKEDVLGLGRIHIQAKRYAKENTVGREEIQKFVGALAVAQSNKGVFITTSSYSKGALEYAENLNGTTTLVLIDGNKLANYIYDFGLGMQVEQTIQIKKLDSDYWDGMVDDK